jgi:hypothetical protein
MPGQIVGTLVRRGFHASAGCLKKVQAHYQASPEEIQKALKNLADKLQSPKSVATLATTFVIFVVIVSAIEYAIRIVAVNLAIVEDSQQTTPSIKPPSEPADELAKVGLLDDYDGEIEERAGQPSKPITSGLRSTFRHLSGVGGFFSRWRGFRMAVFASAAYSFFAVVLSALLSPVPVLSFVLPRFIAAVLTCNLHAAWTHDTIAMPSEKPFFRRFLPRAVARSLVAPTIRLQLGTFVLQFATAGAAAFSQKIVEKHGLNFMTANAYLLPIVVFLAILFGHVLPSHIALIRTEASLLPEDRSAIVPFDRSFGGRVSWEVAEGCERATRKARCIQGFTLRGAYRMFDRATYMRVVKMLVKMFMIMIAITAMFAAIYVVELRTLAGKEIRRAILVGAYRQ